MRACATHHEVPIIADAMAYEVWEHVVCSIFGSFVQLWVHEALECLGRVFSHIAMWACATLKHMGPTLADAVARRLSDAMAHEAGPCNVGTHVQVLT